MIEELVMDEYSLFAISQASRYALVDYKVFAVGERVLWCWMTWCDVVLGVDKKALVSVDYNVLNSTFDPEVCARLRTHDRFLEFGLCSTQEQLPPKPSSWEALVRQASQTAGMLHVFARIDLYADVEHGPLCGEITLFPTMGHPPNLNMQWTNDVVRSVWRDPDGCGSGHSSDDGTCALVPPITSALLLLIESSASKVTTLLDLVQGHGGMIHTMMTSDDLTGAMRTFDLSAYGVLPGDRVSWMLHNALSMAALLLCTMNRYIAVPVNPSLPCDALITSLERAGARALISLDAYKSEAAVTANLIIPFIQLQAGLPTQSIVRALTAAPVSVEAVNRMDDQVLILHTSGTTGTSERVVSSLHRLMASGQALASSMKLTCSDVGVNMMPLHHIGGIACNLLAPLLSQGRMTFEQAFNAATWLSISAGESSSVTWCYAVPTMWEHKLVVADQRRVTCQNACLRVIRSGAAALPHSLAQNLLAWSGACVCVMPTYSMTECMPICSPTLGYRLEKPGSVGRPVGVEMHILDARNNWAALGEQGEVTLISSQHVFEGYETDIAPTPDDGPIPFRTGDLGWLDPDCWLFLTGRSKECINCSGEIIAPTEALKQHSSAGELMVFSAPHKGLQGVLTAPILVMHELTPLRCAFAEVVGLALLSDTKIGLTQLRNWAAARLPMEHLPRVLVLVSELTRTQWIPLRMHGGGEQSSQQLAGSEDTPPGLPPLSADRAQGSSLALGATLPSLWAMLAERANTSGDHTFLQAWSSRAGLMQTVTFGSFASHVAMAAEGLAERGVAPSDRVAFLSHSSVSFFTYASATMCMGAVCVLLNWRQPTATLVGMGASSQCAVLVSSEAFTAQVTDEPTPPKYTD